MPSDQIFTLPFEQQIGQFFFIGLPGTELDAETRELVDEIKPGGVILFGRNVASAEQVRGLLDGVRALLPMQPLCGIDQEGGLVDRLREIFTPMPSARPAHPSRPVEWPGGCVLPGEVPPPPNQCLRCSGREARDELCAGACHRAWRSGR